MRGIYTIAFICAFIIMSASGIAFSQGLNPGLLDFTHSGGGARAAGMGGAYLAVGDGETAFSWNPALLMLADKPKFALQFASIADKFGSVNLEYPYFYGTPNIQPYDLKREHFSLNFAGFSVPFQFMEREWAVGGGYRNVYDMILEYEFPGFVGTTNSYVQDRGMDAASAAIATSIMPGLNLGLNMNAYLRNSEINYFMGAGAGYIVQPSGDTSYVDLWINNSSHFSGFNVDIGAYYDLNFARGSFVVHTPYELVEDIKFTQTAMLAPTPVGFVDRMKYKYSLPAAFSFGLAAIPMENLTLAFDFDYSKLSDVDVSESFEQSVFTDTTVNARWENISQFRIGAEYVLDAGFADVPVRFGFRNEPSVGKQVLGVTFDSADSTWNSTPGDQVSTNIFTLGTGFYLERIWFDIAYQFGSSSYDRTVTYLTSTTYEIKRDYSRLYLSTGMYF